MSQFSNRMATFTLFAAILAGCSRQPPQQRIIILRDWHYVSRDDFAADLRDFDPGISEAELDKWYSTFLADVEMVQNEQTMLLRGLIREHGIRQVFVEGVTDENVDAFRRAVRELPEVDLPELQRRMEESDDYAEQALLLVTMDEYRAKRLELGAVGRLLITGELEDVLPLDDAKLLQAADPTAIGFRFDSEENQEREREMARRLIKGGPVAVAVLGGGHELAGVIKAACPRCVYQAITPEAYMRAVER